MCPEEGEILKSREGSEDLPRESLALSEARVYVLHVVNRPTLYSVVNKFSNLLLTCSRGTHSSFLLFDRNEWVHGIADAAAKVKGPRNLRQVGQVGPDLAAVYRYLY